MANLPDKLRRSLRKCERSPNDAFESFFEWYDDTWLIEKDLWAALDNISRPVREIMVTHQAWGMICSGGPNAYYFRYDRRFDEEVRLGLSALDCAENYAPLAQGRELHETPADQGLTLQENGDIYDQLISLEDLEQRIGSFLLAAMKQ
jgi:hypothetical protein